MRPQNSAVRERGIVHRVWRCLARLRIRTREHRGRFGDGQYPRVRNIAAAAVARDGQREDDIGIASAATGLYVTPNVVAFVNVPAPLCVHAMTDAFVAVASVTVI